MNNANTIKAIPTRRLSPFRVMIALLILVGIGYLGFWKFKDWNSNRNHISLKPWFASYVDVTATPRFEFETLGTVHEQHNVVLSFIVSSSSNACTPTWGNAYTFETASKQLDLDRRIARLRQQGGEIIVSFGGLLNDELAVNCTDPDELVKAYSSVIDKYQIDTIDLDLEGSGLTDITAVIRRADAIAKIQEQRRLQGKSLAVWLTLPVAPQGLSQDGTNAIAQMLAHKVDLSGINVMTMDYGQSKDKNMSMSQASQLALNETHRQLGILYEQSGITLNSDSLWKRIGATAMIGQNDVVEEVFTLDDAKNLNTFAVTQGIARMSMWSANRDVQCGDNYVNLSVVSDSCSGVKQDKLEYMSILGQGFEGDISTNSKVVTKEDIIVDKDMPDDPKNSPYQIWNDESTYLEGTKVVWHRNVYQAKWWTQGDLPDNPVLQAWQTPWQLIGPVLPGEKPIVLLKLPIGTYPNWEGTAQYDAGDRVMFNNIAYQAKWWTQGDSPAATSSNPTASPWVALTQAQLEKIIESLEKK